MGGLKPDYCWELAEGRVHPFDAEESSATAKGLLGVAPAGLEVEVEPWRVLERSLSHAVRKSRSCNSAVTRSSTFTAGWRTLASPSSALLGEELQRCLRPQVSRSNSSRDDLRVDQSELFDLFAECRGS